MKKIAILALVALTSTAFADDKKPAAPAMPKPAAELAQLKYFVGEWSCTGKGFASEMGPEHATKATVKIKMDMNGFFVSGRYEEMKSPENKMPVMAAFVWGWDSVAKKIAATGQDTFGGMFTQTSSGWEGDKIVFSGDALWGSDKTGVRDTFTKKGENEVVHLGEMQMKGQWTSLDEETCKRAMKAAKK
jgi:hypothetical protein